MTTLTLNRPVAFKMPECTTRKAIIVGKDVPRPALWGTAMVQDECSALDEAVARSRFYTAPFFAVGWTYGESVPTSTFHIYLPQPYAASYMCSGEREPIHLPPETGYRTRREKSWYTSHDGLRGHRAGHKGATLRTHREGGA